MKIYQPREELRHYVRYYWVLKGDEPFSILTFPIGCPQIIFHKKTPLYIPELHNSQSQFTISGQVIFFTDPEYCRWRISPVATKNLIKSPQKHNPNPRGYNCNPTR